MSTVAPSASWPISTHRDQLEQELSSAEREALLAAARLDAVIEGARDAIVRLSPDMKIQSWNRAAEITFGLTSNAVLEDFIELFVPEPKRVAFQEWLGQADREGIHGQRVEHELVTHTGATFPAECSVAQRHAVDEDVTLFVRDLSIAKRLEAELRHAQKLEAIGQLAGGMAHEINTPLQYLNDNIDFLGRAFATLLPLTKALSVAVTGWQMTESERAEMAARTKRAKVDFLVQAVPEALSQSREGLEQIGKIVRAMKALTKGGAGVSAAVDLRETVETTVVVAMAEWKNAIDVEVAFDDDLPDVPCVPGEIGQVVLAMVVNACQAIVEKGRDDSLRGKVRVSMCSECEWAVLRVEDDGCGIKPEHKARVFDAFFTTKDVGRGMGQGLAIAHAIIERHKGRIEVDSEVGRGTTFIVKLPLA